MSGTFEVLTRRLIHLSFVCLTASTAWAQSTAQVTGTVKDQTGAVLPGVDVTMTHTNTGVARSAVTDTDGSFVLTALAIGPYRFEASLSGFRSYVQTGIVLEVGTAAVINVSLEVGAVTDALEVTASAQLVETRTTGVGQVMDNVRVLELPLNGRQITDLVLISGAAVQGGASYNMGGRGYPQVAISVAGGITAGVSYMLDGGTHNDPYTGLGVTMPFPDALQEFKLETSALAAQYGQHSAGAVNAVTKSGTNQFNGSLFEFLRNNKLNAPNAITNQKDTLKRNQFGGTVGGPIVQNRLFFFAAHQATKARSSTSPDPMFVFTPAMLAGDFTAFASRACNNGVQRVLRSPAGTNLIQDLGPNAGGDTIYRANPATFSPAGLNLANRLPAAQNECGQVRFNRRFGDNEGVSVGKIDLNLAQNHSIFGRYLEARFDNDTDYDPQNVLTVTRSNLESRIYSFVFGDTYVLGPNVVNTFRATFNHTSNQATPPDYFDVEDLGVRGAYSYVPGFVLTTVTNGFTIGTGNSIRTDYGTLAYQFADDVNVVRGRHQVAFGGNYIRTHETTRLGFSRNPRIMFNAQATGHGLTDLLFGRMSSMVQAGPGIVNKRQHYVGLYVQDTWEVSSRVTVNGGLRWEPYLPPIHNDGFTSFFDKAAFDAGIQSRVYPNAPAGLRFPGDEGVPGKKYSKNQWANFAPRTGVAWAPKGDGRMTVRGAYGIFFELPYFQKGGPVLVAAPYASQVQLNNVSFDDPWATIPGGNPFPLSLDRPIFPLFGTYPFYPTEVDNPAVHQWNVSVQQQLGSNWMVSANYLGTHTEHLWTSFDSNPVAYIPGSSSVANYNQRRQLFLENPTWGQYYGVMPMLDDDGTAHYRALLLSVQHRRADGLTVQGNYTLSKCTGDVEEIQLGIATQYPYPGRSDYYAGTCLQDRRHNFNLSAVYQLPEFSNPALRAIASGWRVSGIARALSGTPLTVASGFDTALTLSISGDRAHQVLDDPYAPNKSKDQWLNPAAFARPATGEWGSQAINGIRGPSFFGLDMGLTRAFRTPRGDSLEFRIEAFNVTNRVNVNNPVVNLNAANFGKITTSGDPRILQLALKYQF